jgi:hypothetical protein
MSDQDAGVAPVEEPVPSAGVPDVKPSAETESHNGRDEDETGAEPTSRAGGGGTGMLNVANPSSAHGFLHSAGVMFAGDARVDGEVIGGDKIVYQLGEAEPIRIRVLSRSECDEVEHGYEESDEFGKLLDRVMTRRTVVLQGPSGRGKKATAIRLLQRMQIETMHRIESDFDLARLSDRLVPAAAYVLFNPARPEKLRGAVLRSLDAELERLHGRLFITIDLDAPIADRDLRDYLVEHCAAPEKLKILSRHLDWRLSVATRTRLLALPEVAELIAELLSDDGPGPRRARDLASLISEEIGEDGVLDVVRVRERMTRHRTDDLDMWFRSLQDLPTRCHAIALAVFSGMPTEYVAEASVRLRKLLEADLRSVELAPGVFVHQGVDPFGTSRPTRLRRLRATVRSARFLGASGLTPTEVEEYIAPDYARGVIERAWRQYEIQKPMLEWLGELVKHDSEPVRVQSAYVVGLLASYAFELTQQRALQPWAESDNPRLREAAAIGLRFTAGDPRFRWTVKRVIRRWYLNKGKPHLQATAALAYGLAIGPEEPDDALEFLDRLAAIDNAEVAVAVGRALAGLLLDHDVAVATDLFVALLRWLDNRYKRLTAELAFLFLAQLYTYEDPTGASASTPNWPLLLDLADREPALRGALAHLWHRVLGGTNFPDEAANVLEMYWAGQVEFDDRACQVFGKLAVAMAEGRERTRLLLLRAADQWTKPTNLRPKRKAATAVRAALGGPEGVWQS